MEFIINIDVITNRAQDSRDSVSVFTVHVKRVTIYKIFKQGQIHSLYLHSPWEGKSVSESRASDRTRPRNSISSTVLSQKAWQGKTPELLHRGDDRLVIFGATTGK